MDGLSAFGLKICGFTIAEAFVSVPLATDLAEKKVVDCAAGPGNGGPGSKAVSLICGELRCEPVVCAFAAWGVCGRREIVPPEAVLGGCA